MEKSKIASVGQKNVFSWLATTHRHDARTQEALVQRLLTDPYWAVRKAAAEQLAELPNLTKETINALRKAAKKDRSKRVKKTILEILKRGDRNGNKRLDS